MLRHSTSVLALACTLVAPALAQEAEVLMLSDIHLDPYAGTAQARTACPDDSPSTGPALVSSALAAAKQAAPHARFVLVAGDFLAHKFQCRYEALHPGASADAYSAFVVETIRGVAAQIKAVFPQVPVLIALGNHDSGCGNYRQDARSRYLREIATVVAQAAARSHREAKQLEAQFAPGAYYSVRVAPRLRIVLLNDTPMSRGFHACDGGSSEWPLADAQFHWLDAQLKQARAEHAKVWLVAHIPPGIEPWGSLRRDDFCERRGPVRFMRTERLAQTIARHEDVVTLGVFGHTHMDEMRWLPGPREAGVPLKILPAITPAGGNMPAFTIGRLDLASGVLSDYTVYSSNSINGTEARWSPLYNYRQTYRLPSYSGAAVQFLSAQMQADSNGSSEASQAYMQAFSSGSGRPASSLLHEDKTWPSYACNLSLPEDEAFTRCACPQGR